MALGLIGAILGTGKDQEQNTGVDMYKKHSDIGTRILGDWANPISYFSNKKIDKLNEQHRLQLEAEAKDRADRTLAMQEAANADNLKTQAQGRSIEGVTTMNNIQQMALKNNAMRSFRNSLFS